MIPPEFIASVNVVLGALIGFLGAMIQLKINNGNQKSRLLAEKLERAHMLAQDVYDGHRKEILKAKRYLPVNIDEYLAKREHPGAKMNELKMLVYGYFPEFSKFLVDAERGHSELKAAFRSMDDKLAETGERQLSFDISSDDWDAALKLVASGTRELKKALEGKMLGLINS